jgi:predicted nucleotidyltransferase component of viral defense system
MKPTEASITASVLARLQNEAKRTGETYNAVLGRFVGFRLLYRLSKSSFADQFLLKGANMFLFWIGAMHRPTSDFDLLGMTADPEELRKIFTEIAVLDCPEDGVMFDPGSIAVQAIREENAYGGVRVTLLGFIGKARIHVQVDIGFGDAVTPAPNEIEIPGMIRDVPSASMGCYNPETSFAEKLEAMTRLGLANSRMKDFFDLATLIQSGILDQELLSQAVKATFTRRKTAQLDTVPLGLTEEFWNDSTVVVRWKAFVRKNQVQPPMDNLEMVCNIIAETVEPLIGK